MIGLVSMNFARQKDLKGLLCRTETIARCYNVVTF